jgi:hypothetical protein
MEENSSVFVDRERFIRGNIGSSRAARTQVICSPIKTLQWCAGTDTCERKRLYKPDFLDRGAPSPAARANSQSGHWFLQMVSVVHGTPSFGEDLVFRHHDEGKEWQALSAPIF